MDINDLRSIVTVLSMLAFIGIVVWAYRHSNREQFNEAAMLPFADEAPAATHDNKNNGGVEQRAKTEGRT
jgi:cytochrome c oxidase cbb3-type subunit 4